MKGKGKKNIKKHLNYRVIILALITILSTAFFAFSGWNLVQSTIVDLQKRLAENEEIDGKERTDNGDGNRVLHCH